MAVRRSFSPAIKPQIYRSNENNLKNSTNNNFHVQDAPPLSFQQYARSLATIPGIKQWQPSGIYRPPPFPSYFSPAVREKREIPVKPWIYAYRRKYSTPTYSLKDYNDLKPKLREPIWHCPGHYIDNRPTSLSPEKKWQKPIHEPFWRSGGTIQYKPVPYFDPPNLRWTLQQLLKSMPDLRTKSLHPARSTSVMRNQYMTNF